MTKEREALRMTLDALERYETKRQDDRFAELITAIKEALAQPSDSVEQEPVGEVSGHDWSTGLLYKDLEPGTPLYTSPPKREWIGLTAEERNAIEAVTLGLHGIPSFFATAIEAKLKELNHD
jgi:hypothetical protein